MDSGDRELGQSRQKAGYRTVWGARRREEAGAALALLSCCPALIFLSFSPSSLPRGCALQCAPLQLTLLGLLQQGCCARVRSTSSCHTPTAPATSTQPSPLPSSLLPPPSLPHPTMSVPSLLFFAYGLVRSPSSDVIEALCQHRMSVPRDAQTAAGTFSPEHRSAFKRGEKP
eukprot:3565637-Rhodomonas_salina.1